MLERNAVDLVIMDIRMPQLGGMDLLRLLKARYRSLPVIMITGFPSIDSAVQSMRYGALNFFVKPLRDPGAPAGDREAQELSSEAPREAPRRR